jgi:dihydropteroate synthase
MSPASQSVSNHPHAAAAASGTLAQLLRVDRPIVMGILNVTPDSFSDGGRFLDPDAAIAHARRMVAEGADIIDVGAESTRPYGTATAVSLDEEVRRLEPVLAAVAGLGVPVSIDTMKAKVAAVALAAGASIVNDVWGLQRDPGMASVVAQHAVPVILMHNRETADPAIDIMGDIAAFFARSLALAERAGIAHDRIVLDPGIGFGKTPEQSLTALARLDRFKTFGLPLLVGASRKRFIDKVSPAPPDRRLGGSLAAHLLAVAGGARIIRAHDVAETVQAFRIAAAIRDAR